MSREADRLSRSLRPGELDADRLDDCVTDLDLDLEGDREDDEYDDLDEDLEERRRRIGDRERLTDLLSFGKGPRSRDRILLSLGESLRAGLRLRSRVKLPVLFN